MKKLKIGKESFTDRDKEFEILITISKTKQLTNEEEKKLLEEIRSGNEEPVERLVDSWEALILSVVKQIPTEIPIEELIVASLKQKISASEKILPVTCL